MAAFRSEVAQEFATTRALVAKDLELLRTSMTIRLGSIVAVGMGMLFAALKLV